MILLGGFCLQQIEFKLHSTPPFSRVNCSYRFPFNWCRILS